MPHSVPSDLGLHCFIFVVNEYNFTVCMNYWTSIFLSALGRQLVGFSYLLLKTLQSRYAYSNKVLKDITIATIRQTGRQIKKKK